MSFLSGSGETKIVITTYTLYESENFIPKGHLEVKIK